MSAPAISPTTPLVLGSASPRRRDILTGLGIPIQVLPADVTETARENEQPDAYLARIVRDKWSAVRELTLRSELGERAVLVADTIVVVGEAILGKPTGDSDAERLLGLIAGRTHVVKTRYAVARPGTASSPDAERTVETRVTMRSASAEEIRRYVATGEGRDKAGAYAAQGIGAFLIERIDGSYTNVVGLPACEVVSDLLALRLLAEFP
jgi:septum formation protein